ncbi:MAG: histone deacetylase [Candidatus Heimdallarchaeota archaeon]|nr:histone deacetylase [Candidatus Heimdallarchaeota archaeon]
MPIRFISNSLSKKHSNGRFHPESAQRIEVLEDWIKNSQGKKITLEILDQFAPKEDILSTHSENLYELIAKTKGISGHFYFDADTTANDYTFDAARQAVAVGKKAIWESTNQNSIFALVRPPGHHATRTSPQGFCIFNNVAIAVELAIKESKYDKIAIIDFDHHFGNGTAYIHERNPNVMYISTHADPRIAYPGCGFVDEIGKGEGRGFNIMMPLGYRASEIDIIMGFEELVLPILRQFKPDFLAISAGFDAYEKDPLGVLGVSTEGFSVIGSYIRNIVSDLRIPYANFLEGGYNIQMLPSLLSSYILPLLSEEIIENERIRNISKFEGDPSNQTKSTIKQAKELLKDFWQV